MKASLGSLRLATSCRRVITRPYTAPPQLSSFLARSRPFHTTLPSSREPSYPSPPDKFGRQQPPRPIKPTSPLAPPTTGPRPEYQMTFTCKPCSERSTHRVSKQAYHHGTSIIQCPKCKVRHIMSDHLKVFGDMLEDTLDIEGILRKKGEEVRKGFVDGESGLTILEGEMSGVSFGEDTGGHNLRVEFRKARTIEGGEDVEIIPALVEGEGVRDA